MSVRDVYESTISFVLFLCPSVCLSVCMEELRSQWNDFRNVLCWGFLFVEKIQVLSISGKKLYMKTAVLLR